VPEGDFRPEGACANFRTGTGGSVLAEKLSDRLAVRSFNWWPSQHDDRHVILLLAFRERMSPRAQTAGELNASFQHPAYGRLYSRLTEQLGAIASLGDAIREERQCATRRNPNSG
jgi:hypothetical protein